MSEIENKIENEEEVNPQQDLFDLLDDIDNKNYTSADASVNAILQDKISDALEQAKINTASTMFNASDDDVAEELAAVLADALDTEEES